ncbi:MAG TPA: PKD domain-containing protein [Thermoanaerobaculia bacterium]|nr:PKD domain-containing protein [Thermoanaerobaculia bacterium]
MKQRAAAILLSILAVLSVLTVIAVVGCDKATPVAPGGSILVISASPTKIALNGTATITVIGRKPDGQPLNPGTEIRLSATNGSIAAIVLTDRDGNATAIFTSNGTPGSATITAATGTGSGTGGGTTTSDGTSTTSGSLSASVTIQVGVSAKTIVVQPTPTVIATPVPSNGTPVQLLATVRDSNGQLQPGQGVNFGTELGTLDSRGGTLTTNASGQAHDTLRVKPSDLLNNPTSIKVTATTAGTDGALITGNATIQVAGGRPVAHFAYNPGSDSRTVQFTNQSTGTGTLSFSWDFGDGTNSSDENPLHPYTADKQYTVRLTVTDLQNQSSVTSATFTIPLTAGGSSSP